MCIHLPVCQWALTEGLGRQPEAGRSGSNSSEVPMPAASVVTYAKPEVPQCAYDASAVITASQSHQVYSTHHFVF